MVEMHSRSNPSDLPDRKLLLELYIQTIPSDRYSCPCTHFPDKNCHLPFLQPSRLITAIHFTIMIICHLSNRTTTRRSEFHIISCIMIDNLIQKNLCVTFRNKSTISIQFYDVFQNIFIKTQETLLNYIL